MRYVVSALAFTLALSGCATTGGGGSSGGGLGSEHSPVRADMPPGQRAYLARLRCSDGQPPQFERIGSMGVQHGHVVDGYAVVCTGAEPAQSTVYMDMYHAGHVETQAVPGFTIVP